MSAPWIWILFPAFCAVVIFILRRWYRSTVVAGILVALFLSLLAWVTPVGEIIELGPWSFEIDDAFNVLGRRFLLGDQDRPMLGMAYLMAAFWFGAAFVARAGKMFVPLGLALVSLLVAALAVEPSLYAALFVEMAVLVSVPILLEPGRQVGRGIIRFIILETLGMPFILFTEWMLAGVETSPGEMSLVMRAAGILGLGFMFLLAIVPFNSWIPMVAEEAHPFAASFVFVMLSWMILLFGLGFLDRYSWLRNDARALESIRFAGLLMVMTGGLGAAFQRHLGRILGFAVLLEVGFSVLAAGLPGGVPLVFMMLLPRALALAVWALALASFWNQKQGMYFTDIQGAGRKLPFLTAAIVVAQFSITGFPLLAGFPVRLALWDQLSVQAVWQATASLFGCLGLFASGVRTLNILVTGPEDHPWQRTENWWVVALMGMGIIAIVLVGIFPQWFLPSLLKGLATFEHLVP